jgi:hypothetical protein
VPLQDSSTPAGTDAEVARRERVNRFERQRAAACLLPRERVCSCLRWMRDAAAGVGIWRSADSGRCHYGGLQVCGSVWTCPVCAGRVAERRRVELEAAIAAHRYAGGSVLLVTWTVRHGAGDDLADVLGRFLAGLSDVTRDRAYKRLKLGYGIVGSIKALEVTWGAGAGWHPHCHSLLFVEGVELDGQAVADLEAALLGAWRQAAGRHGLSMNGRGLRVQATAGAVGDYVAKFGRDPARRPWGAEDEVARAHVKRGRAAAAAGVRFSPFGLLDEFMGTGDLGGAGAVRFREYAAAFKGRRQLRWSPKLRSMFEDTAGRAWVAAVGAGDEAGARVWADRLDVLARAVSSDEDVAAAADEEASHVYQLTAEDWRHILRRGDRRGDLLEVAGELGAAGVDAYVAALWRDEDTAVAVAAVRAEVAGELVGEAPVRRDVWLFNHHFMRRRKMAARAGARAVRPALRV